MNCSLGTLTDLPFPTRVVLLHDQTEETYGDRTRQREGWPAGDDLPKPRQLNEVRMKQNVAEMDDERLARDGDAQRTTIGRLWRRPASTSSEER